MPDKSYIFFEPINDDFFRVVAKVYSKLYAHTLVELVKGLKERYNNNPPIEAINESIEKYLSKIPFPACNVIPEIDCKTPICEDDRYAVVTPRQQKLLTETIKQITAEFEAIHLYRNSIINKLKQKLSWTNKLEIINVEDNNDSVIYLNTYVNEINISIDRYPGNFFFACASTNSSYIDVNTRTGGGLFTACNEFKKL